eukprot:4909151-Lingulodinium_polyedra.AAC.1
MPCCQATKGRCLIAAADMFICRKSSPASALWETNISAMPACSVHQQATVRAHCHRLAFVARPLR